MHILIVGMGNVGLMYANIQKICRIGEVNGENTERLQRILATRRGWVQPIRHRIPRPASRHILGIRVDYPEPVSPAMINTW
ncbi:MAG: hypothetical protein WCW53_11440 [Syntrophales bacterium]